MKIDCYPDADFAGLWKRDDVQDPDCVHSRTGYVTCLANFPVIWKSHLQTEIALSTMEAEYVARSTSCRDLFPLIGITKEILSIFDVDLVVNETVDIRIKIHKDNIRALALGKLEPYRMMPRSKHYAIQYHWFCKHIGPWEIQLVKISSKDQLRDLFTKGLSGVNFPDCKRILWDGDSNIQGSSFEGEYSGYPTHYPTVVPTTLI
jgi:hypothetical protein